MRRSVLEGYGGWTDPSPTARGYEDWDLWMDLAQDERRIVHVGGTLYRRRLHAPGLDVEQRARHAELYRALRDDPPAALRPTCASTAAAPTSRRRASCSTPSSTASGG